jgi:hypothetical protein
MVFHPASYEYVVWFSLVFRPLIGDLHSLWLNQCKINNNNTTTIEVTSSLGFFILLRTST